MPYKTKRGVIEWGVLSSGLFQAADFGIHLLQDRPPLIYKWKANIIVTVIQEAGKAGKHNWEANTWDIPGHAAWSVKQTRTPCLLNAAQDTGQLKEERHDLKQHIASTL